LSSVKPDVVISLAQGWLSKVAGAVREKRRFLLIAKPLNGRPILACRMIHFQQPPSGFMEPFQMLRFVSMLPFISDAEVFDIAREM
jgi:hypothetical protein